MEIKKKLFLTFIKHWKMFECTIFKKIIINFFLIFNSKNNSLLIFRDEFLMKCIFLRKMWAGSIQEETF